MDGCQNKRRVIKEFLITMDSVCSLDELKDAVIPVKMKDGSEVVFKIEIVSKKDKEPTIKLIKSG